MSTPPDEMKRRAAARLATVPPSGNVPVGPPRAQMSPQAAGMNEAMRAERARVSPLARDINASLSQQRAAQAAPPRPLPAYRTPDGFVQTPAPTNPNPRAASAIAAPATPPAPSAAAARVPGATGRPLRAAAGKVGVGGAAALALEGLNIAGAAQEGGVTGAAGETAAAATRLGTAKVGMDLGRRIPGPPIAKAAAAALGGIGGYVGGQELVDTVRENAPDGTGDVLETMNYWGQRSGNSLVPGLGNLMFGEEQFTPRFGPGAQPRAPVAAPATAPSVRGPNPAAAARLAAPAPSPVPAAPASAQQNTIGTFQLQGRPERQVFEDGSVSPASAGSGAFSVIPAYQGTASPAAARLAAPSIAGPGFADSERRQFSEQIDAQIKGLGELNMASKRRLVADLLGLKGRNVGMGFEAATGRNAAQAQLMQQASEAQLRADVDREQITAGERSSKRSQTQTITAEDGTVYSVDGSTLTPLTTSDGQQIRAPRKAAPNAQAEIAAQLLEGMLLPGATPEDVQAAAQQASAAAAALLSGPGGQQAPRAKPAEAEFLEAARASNPGVSDDELKAYYKSTYGG